MKYAFKIGANAYSVEVGEMIAGQVRVAVNGKSFNVAVDDSIPQPLQVSLPAAAKTAPPVRQSRSAESKPTPPAASTAAAAESGAVIAPMPGLILEIKVKVGDTVEAGQWVATMEAMKMENQLTAPVFGIVKEIDIQKGSEVNTGQVIMQIG